MDSVRVSCTILTGGGVSGALGREACQPLLWGDRRGGGGGGVGRGGKRAPRELPVQKVALGSQRASVGGACEQSAARPEFERPKVKSIRGFSN